MGMFIKDQINKVRFDFDKSFKDVNKKVMEC